MERNRQVLRRQDLRRLPPCGRDQHLLPGLDYSLHVELPQPPNAISIDQAGEEILAGIRNGQEVIPVNEDARDLYKATREGDGDAVETFMQLVKQMNLNKISLASAATAKSEEEQ